MKARLAPKDTDKFILTKADIKKAVEEQFMEKEFELYEHCAQDITVQVLSNVLNTLEYWYGWKKDRLNKFIELLHKEEDDMVQLGITTLDNVARFKKKYGIDLADEFPARVEKDQFIERNDRK